MRSLRSQVLRAGGGRVTAAEKVLVFVAYGLGLVVGFLTGLVFG